MMLNKCPKCGSDIRVHVPVIVCCDPNGVPQNEAQLMYGLLNGLVHPIGLIEPDEAEVHCVNERCQWQKSVRYVGPDDPKHPKKMPLHSLN
jgi:hypothetical protein